MRARGRRYERRGQFLQRSLKCCSDDLVAHHLSPFRPVGVDWTGAAVIGR
jgi:hypothetical protein